MPAGEESERAGGKGVEALLAEEAQRSLAAKEEAVSESRAALRHPPHVAVPISLYVPSRRPLLGT